MVTQNNSLDKLLQEREHCEKSLKELEQQIYALETVYLQESMLFKDSTLEIEDIFNNTSQDFSLLRGALEDKDRIFLLSSLTSPLVQRISSRKEDSAQASTTATYNEDTDNLENLDENQ